jgi:hypothetical protein
MMDGDDGLPWNHGREDAARPHTRAALSSLGFFILFCEAIGTTGSTLFSGALNHAK